MKKMDKEIEYYPTIKRTEFRRFGVFYLCAWMFFLHRCVVCITNMFDACEEGCLELEAQMLWDILWILRTKSGFSARTSNVLNHWTISAAPKVMIFLSGSVELNFIRKVKIFQLTHWHMIEV